MLVTLTDAHSEAEAEMICGRLAAEGIEATFKHQIGTDLPEVGAGALHEIFVEEGDLQRARALIASGGFTDGELSALSQDAPPPPELS
jgi:Putative prokaryotic signal transducing protein